MTMAGNITTLAAQVVVKDNTADGMAKVVAALRQTSKTISQTLNDPISEADRQLQSLINSTTKLANKSNWQILSDREVQKLEQTRLALEGILSRLNTAGGASLPGFDNLARNVGMMQQLVSQSQQLRMMPSSNINAIRDFEVMGAMTRPGYVNDPLKSARVQRNMMLRDRDAYEQWWEQNTTSGLTSRFAANQEFGMPAGFGPLGLGRTSAYIDPNSAARAARAARGTRDQYEAWWRSQNIANPTASRFVQNREEFGMPAGFAPLDLGRASRTAEIREGRHRASSIASSERGASQQRRMVDLEQDYRNEALVVDTLTKKYAGLNEEQQKSLNIRLRAKQDAGFNVTAQQSALREVMDPWSVTNRNKTGRGSATHAMHFGAQNLAFGIEDFLMASQYGGVKAGIRASVNNLTAIMAAATGALNPATGAGLIAGTALLGAAAPSVYGYFTGDDERKQARSDIQQRYFEGREVQQSNLITLTRGLNRTSKLDSATQKYQEEMDAYTDLQRKREVLQNRRDFGSGGLHGVKLEEFREGIEKELAGLPTLEEQGSRVNYTVDAIKRLQGRYDLNRERVQGRIPVDTELHRRQASGELINPAETYALKKTRLREDLADSLKHATDAERVILNDRFKSDELSLLAEEAQAGIDFQIRSRNRGFQHRLRLADFEIDPRKKLAQQHAVQREQILADKGLSPEQQRLELAGLDKMYKRQLREAGDMPALGDAINVGSAEDVRLRQKFFDRKGEGGGESEAQKELKRIYEAIRDMHDTLKKATPKPANFKKK